MSTAQTKLEKLELLYRLTNSNAEKENWINNLKQLLDYRAEVAKRYLKNQDSEDYYELIEHCNEQIKKLLGVW